MSFDNKRILVISNDAFSSSNSNGRTLMNFLKNIPKEYLAQFYIHGVPDREICCAYYQNSDADALNAFLGREKDRKNIPDNEKNISQNSGVKVKYKRNFVNLLIRNTVWCSMRWWGREFDDFLDEFRPEVVLLQAGDAPFMYAVALKVSAKFGAGLLMFNSESYVLKKRMYASARRYSLWHALFMSSLRKQYSKFMDKADYCIYSLEALEKAYQERYPHVGRSCTLYTTSEMPSLPDRSGEQFTLLYCGNLGVGRDEPINQLAKVLYEIDTSARIDIYGKFVSEESKKLICSNPNVCYKGFVDYSEIPDLMSRASMLFHCENNGRLENLRYAFSTKIADSLACARPFLVYASREYPFVQYLEKNKCAHIASDPGELKSVLSKCINDREYRYRFTDNARKVALKNHNREANSRRIAEIIEQIT